MCIYRRKNDASESVFDADLHPGVETWLEMTTILLWFVKKVQLFMDIYGYIWLQSRFKMIVVSQDSAL